MTGPLCPGAEDRGGPCFGGGGACLEGFTVRILAPGRQQWRQGDGQLVWSRQIPPLFHSNRCVCVSVPGGGTLPEGLLPCLLYPRGVPTLMVSFSPPLQTSQGVQVRRFQTLSDLIALYLQPNQGLVCTLLFPVEREKENVEDRDYSGTGLGPPSVVALGVCMLGWRGLEQLVGGGARRPLLAGEPPCGLPSPAGSALQREDLQGLAPALETGQRRSSAGGGGGCPSLLFRAGISLHRARRKAC